MALLEGMSLGLPSVASDYGGNPWVIQDGENGLLFPTKDSQALADAMARTAALYGARRCWYLVAGPPSACWRASAHWHRSAARSLRRATATRLSTTRLSWGS